MIIVVWKCTTHLAGSLTNQQQKVEGLQLQGICLEVHNKVIFVQNVILVFMSPPCAFRNIVDVTVDIQFGNSMNNEYLHLLASKLLVCWNAWHQKHSRHSLAP